MSRRANTAVALADDDVPDDLPLTSASIGGDRDDAPPRDSAVSDTQESAGEVAAPSDDRAVRNFLAMYFREMSLLSVLRPEEEFSAAREIERLELELWESALSFAPLADVVMAALEHSMGAHPRELRAAMALCYRARRLRRPVSTSARDRLKASARVLAPRLRAVDIDREFVGSVIDEVERIAKGEAPRFGRQRRAPTVPPVAFVRWWDELRVARDRVQDAKAAFVKANLRLVVSIARRFNYGRMPFPDLIQEGNIGLMKAVDRFDYRRGFRFSTYASWWIRHAISRALADKGRAVRLPVHMIDTYHRVAKASRELTAKLGRPPTTQEIGKAAGVEGEKVDRMKTYLVEESYSLDRTVSEEDDRRFIDFLVDSDGSPSILEHLATQTLADEVLKVLDELKPIEADILRQRFGLETDEEKTLKQIGDRYHLSRERIRQLQEQALTKVRRALERKEML